MNSLNAQILQLAPILLMVVLFYFMLIRPQQKRAKEHQNMLANLKRGDTVVLSSGVLGKIVRVEDKEVGVEIAQGVTREGRQGHDHGSPRQGRAGRGQRRQELRRTPPFARRS